MTLIEAGGYQLVFRSLRRHWKMAAFLTVALSMVLIAAILVMPRKWTASAYLVIEDGQPRVVNVEGVIPQSPVDVEALASEVEILKSDAVADAAAALVGYERLIRDEAGPAQEKTADGPGDQPPVYAELAAKGAALLRDVLDAVRGPQPDIAPATMQEKAVSVLQSRMDVEAVGQSRVIAVHYTARDPQLARDAAAAIAETYLRRREDRHTLVNSTARSRVHEEIARVREEVADAEMVMERYRSDNGLLKGQRGGLIRQESIASYEERLAEAKAAFAEASSNAVQVRRLLNSTSYGGAMPEVLSNPAVEVLRQREVEIRAEMSRLRANYRTDGLVISNLQSQVDQVRAELQRELTRAVEAAEARAQLAGARLASIQAVTGEATAKLSDANQKGVQLNVLEREVEAGRNLLELLLRREQELSAQLSVGAPLDAYLLSSVSTPRKPSFPQPMPMAALAVLAAAFVSVGFVVVREVRDQTLKSEEEINMLVPHMALGLVPSIQRVRKGHTLQIENLERDRYAEAVKGIYIQLMQTSEVLPRKIMVTSALPGEGKTTMAASLGVMISAMDRRVAIIDVDARRPSLHRLFGQALSPGLLNLFRGEAKASEIVRPINGKLSVITVGAGDNLSDLLHADRLNALINDLLTEYDHVIIDTPPTLAVSEAVALAPMVDRILHLVRWGQTRRSTFLASIRQFRHFDPSLLSVVLYNVDIRRHRSYGFVDSELYHESLNRYYLG